MKNNKFINNIICADALEFLPQIETDSIDVVLTDPPYFLDKLDNKLLILVLHKYDKILYIGRLEDLLQW